MTRHDDPRDADTGIAIVRLIEKHDFNTASAQTCYAEILDALLKAAHQTERDRETQRMLRAGRRMCPSCGNFPDGAA